MEDRTIQDAAVNLGAYRRQRILTIDIIIIPRERSLNNGPRLLRWMLTELLEPQHCSRPVSTCHRQATRDNNDTLRATGGVLDRFVGAERSSHRSR